MKLTVAHPVSLRSCDRLHGYWVYADDDLEAYSKVKSHFGSALQPLVAPDEFQAEASRLHRPFIEWVDRNLAGSPSEDWITTPLYKNPSNNNFFLHAAWLAIIKNALTHGRGPLLIVTRSLGLAMTLKSFCKENGVAYEAIGPAALALGRGRSNFRAWMGFGFNMLQLVYRLVLARLIFGRDYRQRLTELDVLVDTYLFESDFTDDNRFCDRYFPGLIKWYSKRGFQAASYPYLYRIPISKLSLTYRKMKASSTLFVPIELFLTVTDLFYAAWKCACAAGRRGRLAEPVFLDVNLGPLIKHLRLQTALWGLYPMLLMLAPRRLGASGIRPKWLVEWYENQPKDKASQIGFKEIGSPCRVIATRQYPPHPYYLSLYTTTAEVAAGVAPNENWVCGEASIQIMSMYDSKGKYRAVPALRYAHLYDEISEIKSEKNLLILLSYAQNDSLGILSSVIP
ncbi:MAG: hypothetical protein ACREUA_02305, partial [Burkholderiales bacterium]